MSRVLAIALTTLGVGLISGAVTQVAALDGSLERAAARPDKPPSSLVRFEDGSGPTHRCSHPRRMRPAVIPGQPT
jgi:hypothetical protein